MADTITATLDTTGLMATLDALAGPIKESLSRRMLVEGGVLLRDAAASNARMAANQEGVEVRGLLARSIYLAFDEKSSAGDLFNYTVSWNRKIAPHGHLIEFGHWQTHVAYKGSNGEWYTRKDMPLDAPRWIPARPFLRPTLDSYGKTAISVMLRRGQTELPKLLAEYAA